MKYILFTLAMLAMIPGAVLCGLSRRMLVIALVVMFLPLLQFDSLALNFISYEFYRGTARGMEVSFTYLVALMILSSLLFRRKFPKVLPDFGAVLYFLYFVCAIISTFANDTTRIVEGVMVADVLQSDFEVSGRMLSFFELWKMLMLSLVFWAVYGFLDLTKKPEVVIRALGIIVICCFLSVVHEYFAGVYQARGVFPHQNSMALFMMLLGPVFFAAYLNLPQSFFRHFCTVAFVCASGALLRTYSRGAMLCYPLASCATAFWSIVTRFQFRKISRLLPLVLCGILGVSAMLPQMIDRYENAPQQSADTRKWLALTAVNVMRQHPWTGIGVNNWSQYVSSHPEAQAGEEFRPNDSTGTNIGIVETIYLLVGAECGVPGLLLLISWFLYYWFVAFRLTFKLSGTRWSYIPVGLLGGLTGCYLQSALEWVLKQQINFLLLMVCFAMLSWLNQNWRSLKAAEVKQGVEAA